MVQPDVCFLSHRLMDLVYRVIEGGFFKNSRKVKPTGAICAAGGAKKGRMPMHTALSGGLQPLPYFKAKAMYVRYAKETQKIRI